MKTFPRSRFALALALLASGCAVTPPAPPPPAPAPSHAPAAPAYVPPPPAAPTDADLRRRADFDAALAKWHGASLAELSSKLGKPTTVTHRGDGSSVYAYTRSSSGQSRFSCTVRYVVDDKTQRVQGHQIEGC